MLGIGPLGGVFDTYDDKSAVCQAIGTKIISPETPMSEWVNKLNNSDGTSIADIVGSSNNLGQELLDIKKVMNKSLISKGVNVNINNTMLELANNIDNIDNFQDPVWLKEASFKIAKDLCTVVSYGDAVTYNDYIFLCDGSNNFIKYNCITGDSEIINTDTVIKTNYTKLILVNDDIYAFGRGYSKKYNILTGVVTDLAISNTLFRTTCLCNNKIYGFESSYNSLNVECYDISTNSWSQSTEISDSNYRFSNENIACCCIGNTIYIVMSGALYAYFQETNTIIKIMSAPALYNQPAPKLVYKNNKIYVHCSTVMYELNLETKTHTMIGNTPNINKEYEVMEQYKNSICVFGGTGEQAVTRWSI